MSARPAFGDVELMLMEFFADLGYCVTSTPDNLKTRLATGYVIRIARVGGGEDSRGVVDEPRVNIQVFALASSVKPRDAHDGAKMIRTRIRNLTGAVTTHGRLDSGTTESGPISFSWPDPEVKVVQQVFRLQTRP